MSDERNPLSIRGDNISKRFGYRAIFRNINFEFHSPHSTAITGPNGSGKSTLLKILAGIISPASGSIEFNLNGRTISREERFSSIGYLGPEINPYDELTAYENIIFAASGASKNGRFESAPSGRADLLLSELGISRYRDSPVKVFSSGMRQRLKFILAVINDPPVLFLDEPGMNLDSAGKEAVYKMISGFAAEKIVVIAANESSEIALCGGRIDLVQP